MKDLNELSSDCIHVLLSRCPGLGPDLLQRGSFDRRSQAPSHTGADDGGWRWGWGTGGGSWGLKERLICITELQFNVSLCVVSHRKAN